MKILAILALLALATPMAWLAAREPAMPPPAPAAAATWQIDPGHSSLVFKIKHMGVSNFYGRFNKITGTLVVDDAKPENSKVELTIPTESVDTNSSQRDGHLKSPDFFNAAEFGEINFTSLTVKKAGANSYKVEGELTLHGVTNPLTVTVERIGSTESKDGKVCGFDVQFAIKRSEYGMTFMLDGIGDDVSVMAGIECRSK